MTRGAALALVALVDAALLAALFSVVRSVVRTRPFAARGSLLAFLLLMAAAALVLAQSPYAASNCRVSDAAEYLAAARRFYHHGTPDLPIAGGALPTRFPIWFSVLILSPAYFLFGPELGNPIAAVTALALLGAAAAYAAAARIGGTAGGLTAGLLLLLNPAYRFFGREVLTDVPAAALVVVLSAAWSSEERNRASHAASVGMLAALSAALRPLTALVLLPFYWRLLAEKPPHRRRQALLLTLPLVVLGLASAVYRAKTFGSPFRSGYQLWMAVPYDYASLAFSIRYLPGNLVKAAEHTAVVPYLLLLAVLYAARKPPAGSVDAGAAVLLKEYARFVALACVPIACAYLVYFYFSSRFYLPLDAPLAVLAGALTGLVLRDRVPQRSLFVLMLVLVCTLAVQRAAKGPAAGGPRDDAERIAAAVPPGASVVSAINPVYLQELLGPARTVVPLSRRVEYAGKLLAWRKIEPPPVLPEWSDHRAPFLIEGGAEEAFKDVAAESIGRLKQAMQSGKKVYLDVSAATDEERAVFEKEFVLEPAAPALYRLRLPPPGGGQG